MALKNVPVAKAEMLVRKPAAEVFRAFVDPSVTTKFWFTKSSGPLEAGKKVRWEWEMYGAAADVDVKVVENDARIVIEWGNHARTSTVEWKFHSRPDGTTLVQIENRGFAGDEDEVVAQAIDAKGGFTTVLAGLKAYLEHGLQLGLVGDQHPDAHRK